MYVVAYICLLFGEFFDMASAKNLIKRAKNSLAALSVIELGICIISMRGSILDTSERSSIQYWLYIRLSELKHSTMYDLIATFEFLSFSFDVGQLWRCRQWSNLVQRVLRQVPTRRVKKDCDELNIVQSPRRASCCHDDLLHIRSSWSFVGENEGLSTVDAWVWVAFQLSPKWIDESKLETTKSYACISGQLESTV